MRICSPTLLLAVGALLAGCASNPEAKFSAADCGAEIERLNAQLAAEIAERQRLTRAATRREGALRKQLDAMKSIERGIIEREDRARTETR